MGNTCVIGGTEGVFSEVAIAGPDAEERVPCFRTGFHE